MLTNDKRLYLASADGREICLEPAMANRHGLVTGATGTGKTVTLQGLAEGFSALGAPVFLTDVKGDLAGLSQTGHPQGGLAARIDQLNLRSRGYQNRPFPICFWDVFGQTGHPLRSTISEMGPLLLSRLLDLTETQSGLMHLMFRLADDQGLPLLDLKDLRALAAYAGDHAKELRAAYGQISPASVGVIQRGLLRLEEEGAEHFFGEPALRIEDLFLTDFDGRGVIHILAADRLTNSPRLYSTLLLGLLSELHERLPETGDQSRPRLALMFDEAHLIFSEAPAALLEKMEQAVRLIRSKGVGVYFITQNPADIPEPILAQLGNRVQHALRAYTPKEQKAVRVAARAFRSNPALDTEETITQLGIGEALVSFLDSEGIPGMVERALILPPESRVGTIAPEERRAALAASRLAGRYDQAVDRESAYELLTRRLDQIQREAEASQKAGQEAQETREQAARDREAERQARREAGAKKPDIIGTVLQDMTRQATRTIGREVGRSILRGILGGLFGGKR